MSQYTDFGISVSPDAGIYFLRLLSTLTEGPDMVAKDKDGSISAVWQNSNHFHSSPDYETIMAFLDNLGDDDYVYEDITEDCAPEVVGGYYFHFSRSTVYKLDGTEIDPETVMSQNRKCGFFGRRF